MNASPPRTISVPQPIPIMASKLGFVVGFMGFGSDASPGRLGAVASMRWATISIRLVCDNRGKGRPAVSSPVVFCGRKADVWAVTFNAASRASIKSLPFWYRWLGDLLKPVNKTASTCVLSLGLICRGEGGSSVRCWIASEVGDGSSNGSAPVSIW